MRLVPRLCVLAALPLCLRPAPARAQEAWQELTVGRFSILYPLEHAEEVAGFAGRYGPALNDLYSVFSALYGETLSPPIAIRLYDDREQFAELNALAPQLGEGAFHAHSGAREIALVAPFPQNLFESDLILNVVRHELTGLFLSQLSDGGLPPGLAVGFSQYAELPGPQTQAARDAVSAALAGGQLRPWSEVLDGPWVYLDRATAYPQSLSIAAFLLDGYGFGKWLEFVRAIPDAGGYRAALAQVYGRPVDRLELDWLAYLPAYLESRWQVNALYNYDLAPFQSALEAGAYTQVLRGLDYVLPFLQLTGQTEKILRAEALYAVAQQGVAAGELVKAARDEVQNGEYDLALQLADEARAAYANLPEASRLAELDGYAARAREALDLRAQLDAASRLAAFGQLAEAESQLLALVPRLQSLGDAEGAARAEALLSGLRARRAAAARWAIAAAMVVAGAVVARRRRALAKGRSEKSVRVL
jgi:hypothetical protein